MVVCRLKFQEGGTEAAGLVIAHGEPLGDLLSIGCRTGALEGVPGG